VSVDNGTSGSGGGGVGSVIILVIIIVVKRTGSLSNRGDRLARGENGERSGPGGRG